MAAAEQERRQHVSACMQIFSKEGVRKGERETDVGENGKSKNNSLPARPPRSITSAAGLLAHFENLTYNLKGLSSEIYLATL